MPGPAYSECPTRHTGLEAGGSRQLRFDGRLHLLPDTRHPEKDRRLDFLEMVTQRFHAAGVVKLKTGMSLVVHAAHLFGRVGHGEVGDQSLALIGLADLDHGGRHPPQIALTQGHRLGRSCRARGVNEGASVVGIQLGHACIQDLIRDGLRRRQEAGPRQLRQWKVGGGGVRLEHHHLAQVGHAIGAGLNARPPLRVLHHQHLGLRVVQNVGHVVDRARPVNTGRLGANRHGRKSGDGPLRPVEAEDGNRVTALNAHADQRAGCLSDL